MPRASIRVPTGSQQYLGPDFAEETGNKFKHHSFLIYTVLIVAAISFVGFVISTVTLYNDQAHFNNQTYKEEAASTRAEVTELKTTVNALRNETNSLKTELEVARKLKQ